MQVSVEKISNTERRLTIVVSSDQIEQAYAKEVNDYAKKANIKGFRPGKVPLSYVERQFGKFLREEAMENVIKKSLQIAMRQENLAPVSLPKIEPKSLITQDQPFEFVASFEVFPEIADITFSMASIEKLTVEIKQEDIAYVTSQLLKQYTKWKVVDRPAELHDRIVIDYHSIYEGKAETERQMQKVPLELGSNMMIPGFEDGLVGAKADEERTLHLSYPADFPMTERAGKEVDFVVHVSQVFAAEKPELNSEFIQKLGIKSGKEEDFTQQIKNTLEQERNRLIKEKVKSQVFQVLLEQNPIDIPNAMIEREAKQAHDEVHPHHSDSQHSLAQHSADEIASYQDIAKKRVALGLLVSEYAKRHHIKPDQARVTARIAEIASAYEDPQEVIEWLSSEKNRHEIEAQALEDQAVDKLLETVAVVEKTLSYNELKGIKP